MVTGGGDAPASVGIDNRRPMVSPSFHRLMLVMMICAGILNYADRQVIAILKPMLEGDLGWTNAQYGGLVSAFQFSAAIAFLFVGWLVDRIGLVRANPLGVAAWSLAAMAHGLASTLPQFLAARVALGATEAIGTPAAVKTIASLFSEEQRAMALGTMNAASSIGAILTPLAVPFLALAVGWRWTFVLLGAGGLLWVAAWGMVIRGKAALFHSPAAQPSPGSVSNWVLAFRDRRTLAIAGAKALSDQVWWFLLFWAPDLLRRQFHLDMADLAVPLAVIYLAAATGALVGGFGYGTLRTHAATPNYARKLIFLICGLCVVPVPLVLEMESVWSAVAILGLTLAAHQAFSANLFALITDIVPSSRLGLVTGIGALSGNLSGMLVLQATGLLLSGGFGYQPVLLLASCAYLLALGWLHLLVPVFPDPDLAPPMAVPSS